MAKRADFEALDRADELAAFRAQFELPDNLVYLDGNSLGALPRSARERVAHVVAQEWGHGLIRSWDQADWIGLPLRAGEKVARLIGAAPGQVVVADSTSVNLYKVLSVALAARGERRLVIAEGTGFPTDLYMAQGLIAQLGQGHELVLVGRGTGELEAALAKRASEAAAVLLTHVDYRSGHMHDMAGITRLAHDAGALIVWDLAHSAGAMPVELDSCDADFAVGCGYKFLNGGPGAPAFVYVARRLQEGQVQPLTGWMGHANPFAFESGYEAAAGIARFLCGTPAILAMSALDSALDVMLEAPMEAIRRKSMALGVKFVSLVGEECGGHGLKLASPVDPQLRGSQISYSHPRSHTIMDALIARGVIGDCREPDILRFGFAPLYNRYVDVWDAVVALRAALS